MDNADGKNTEGEMVYRIYCGQQLINTFEVKAHAEAFANDRAALTGFSVGGTYNRIVVEVVKF